VIFKSNALYLLRLVVLIMGTISFTGESLYGQTTSMIPNSSIPSSIPQTEPENAVTMTDIHDIKPPETLGINPSYIYYGLLVLLVLALFIAGWVYWYRKRKQKIIEEVEISLPPEEIALNALKSLSKRGYVDGRVFYFELSAILRSYIQDRFKVNALEKTSEELMPIIENLSVERDVQRDLKELIRSAEPVKFAASPANQIKMEGDIEFVQRFVKQTTPVEEHV